jgi:hypothetical protein
LNVDSDYVEHGYRMSLADITPHPESPVEPPAFQDALRQWNVLMGDVALRHHHSSGQGTNLHYQARIEELGPDGNWTKIGLLDSTIREADLSGWPPEELTRIFLQDRCAAAIATLPQGRTLTIHGIGHWRYNETKGTRVVGLDSGLPAVRVRGVSGIFRVGGAVKIIEDDLSGIEIARFREMRVRPPREETDFPIRMLPARWRASLCTPPRLFQSFGPPEMFAHPSMVPLIAAVALRQRAVDSLPRTK